MKCYLLSFQSQLNENLLQLLIHKVDTKLFKSIFLKNNWKHKIDNYEPNLIPVDKWKQIRCKYHKQWFNIIINSI